MEYWVAAGLLLLLSLCSVEGTVMPVKNNCSVSVLYDEIPEQMRCEYVLKNCRGGRNMLNYLAVHFCWARESRGMSVGLLVAVVMLIFTAMASVAEQHFSRAVKKSAAILGLSQNMAGVTLLAMANGAPDVFSSLAALRGGNASVGFAGVLSGGTFVSSFVVGCVSLSCAPFCVRPLCFLRDLLFYLVSSSALFYVYLSGIIFLWQAIGMLLFYAFFVAIVFLYPSSAQQHDDFVVDDDDDDVGVDIPIRVSESTRESHCLALNQIKQIWEFPITLLFRLTIPSINSSDWNRFYASANITLCPLVFLYFLSPSIPLDYKMVFLIPNLYLPLWVVVLVQSSCVGFAYFLVIGDPPRKDQKVYVLLSFIMSVCWISFLAGELLGCLAALGVILKLPSALLGLTLLAWGNSIGDLVTDVSVARSGQPAMAIAGCYAGPMFNMLIGLGSSLVSCTAATFPSGYSLQFHFSIVIAFTFLFMGLFGSLLVITWSRFQVPRFWGFCLAAWYVLFVLVSLLLTDID